MEKVKFELNGKQVEANPEQNRNLALGAANPV
jgi:hypothetical protein